MIRTLKGAARTASAVLAGAILISAASCASPTGPSVKVAFQKIDLKVGTGAMATAGSTLSVTYTGWLYDPSRDDKKGEQFDASQAGRPFVFWLGTNQVIAGWDQGLVGMKVGGIRRLIVPAELAYGRAGAGDRIPPNASLVFDIELLSVFN